MEEHDNSAHQHTHNSDRDELYSKVVRAGKRTYFFDVKATKANDFYLTITESKKRFNREGRHFYEKHKLFLYKEDFDKFTDAMGDVLEKIAALQDEHGIPEPNYASSAGEHGDEEINAEKMEPVASVDSFTDVSFEDLGTESH